MRYGVFGGCLVLVLRASCAKRIGNVYEIDCIDDAEWTAIRSRIRAISRLYRPVLNYKERRVQEWISLNLSLFFLLLYF